MLFAAGACGAGEASTAGRGVSGEVTVFAASSLTESFTELGRMLADEHPGVRVTFNFASSSDLAIQLTQGAPADLFASADATQMGVVERAGLVEHPIDFATNRLVVVTPADNPAGVQSARDLAHSGVKIVLAGPEVPAGSYARGAFASMGIEDAVERNVVSNEDDVKQVVAKVQLGEADAGVVYVTDVTSEVEDEVKVIEFPDAAQIEAVYPISIVEEGPNPAGAKAFYDLVLSDEGQAVLRSHGFGSP